MSHHKPWLRPATRRPAASPPAGPSGPCPGLFWPLPVLSELREAPVWGAVGSSNSGGALGTSGPWSTRGQLLALNGEPGGM